MSSHVSPDPSVLSTPPPSSRIDIVTRREWWQRRPTGYLPTTPFAIEIEVHDEYDLPRAITREIHTMQECTREPGAKLTWTTLTARQARELVMVANHTGGWSTFELLEYDETQRREAWQLPLKKKGEAHFRERKPTAEAVARRRRLERDARTAVASLPTRQLADLRVELQRKLQAVEDEETMRWGALCDEAERLGRGDLNPANRRGAPVWWIEDDFPNHQRLYEARHRKLGTLEEY